jgi:hypothetical protein
MPRRLLARLCRAGAARRVSALLAMLALLLQLGVPLAHDPIGLGAVAPWLGAALCHAGSDAAHRSAPAQDPAPADPKASLCPICISLQASLGFIAPPAGATVSSVALLPLPLVPPRTTLRLARALGFTSQPRAPPVA